jgi:hypothetical protein
VGYKYDVSLLGNASINLLAILFYFASRILGTPLRCKHNYLLVHFVSLSLFQNSLQKV